MTSGKNPYLTEKAVARKKSAIPILLICGTFASAALISAAELFTEGEMLSGVMTLFMLAALMTPIVRIFLNIYRKACARRIAGALLPLTEESLTFDGLETVLSSGKALEQIQSLIGKGYLQNLRIDSENRTVGLYMPEGSLVQWVCPGCGAKNLARRGGPMRCRYCDQPRGQ